VQSEWDWHKLEFSSTIFVIVGDDGSTQFPPTSTTGMQRQLLEGHGGISNGEQIPEQSSPGQSSAPFIIGNIAVNDKDN